MHLPWSLWLVLGLLGLGYVFVTAAMSTIANRFDFARRRHECVVQARQLRFDYEKELVDRREELLAEIGFETDEEGVILVGGE